MLIYFSITATLDFMNDNEEIKYQFLKDLGSRIREIRIQKGLSQSEVANRCGKERQSYQRVESGNVSPTLWYLQHIAMALEVDLKDLIPENPTKPNI